MKFAPYGTKVPEGQYRVNFVGYDEGIAFGAPRWFGHFKIAEEGSYHDLPILRVWNRPRGSFLARSHNLSRDFMALTGKRPPSSGLTPDDFLADCEVVATVATVIHQIDGRKRIALPEDCHYSKIDGFVSISLGCPPCLRRDT